MLKNLLDCFLQWKLEQNLITEEQLSNEWFKGGNFFLEKKIILNLPVQQHFLNEKMKQVENESLQNL